MSIASAAAPAAPRTIWPPADPVIGGRPRADEQPAPKSGAGDSKLWIGLGGLGVAAVAIGAGIVTGAFKNGGTLGTVLKGAALLGGVVGVGALAMRGGTGGSMEMFAPFATEPNLDGVPPGEVYATLRAHHERNAPAVERELAALKDEGKVTSYSGIIGANGFVLDVPRTHAAEVERRLEVLTEVGDVQDADLR